MQESVQKMGGSLTGLSDDEAKEFHRLWVQSYLLYTGVAIVAHFLVWMWRPWLGPAQPWRTSDVLDIVTHTISYMV